MAYAATSTYQYTTGDILEAFHICDYSTIDALYTEAAVMAQVSHAERWVNEYCGQTFTAGAAPDGVVSATLEMARYFMNIQMLGDSHIKEFTIKLNSIIKLCEGFLAKNKVTPTYSGSSDDFHLPILGD